MTVQIQKFINKIKVAEARGARDMSIPLGEAKDLHAELTTLLLQMQDLRSQYIEKQENEVVEINMSGGSFK